MRLPHAEHAIISPDKLRDYILSVDHPKGVHKARVFRVAGYESDKWWVLSSDLKFLAVTNEAAELIGSKHGRKFEVRGTLHGPIRPVDVVTVWIVLRRERFPRFVTMYPERIR